MRPMLPRYNSGRVARPLRHIGLVLRLGLAGLVGAALCWALGLAYERAVLGPDDGSARARLEQRASAQLAERAGELTAVIDALSSAVPDIEATLAGDREAERRLFQRAAQVSGAPDTGLSVSIFDASLQPRAWAGAPVAEPLRPASPGQAVWRILTRGDDACLVLSLSPVREGGMPGPAGLLVAERRIGRASPLNPSEYFLTVDGIDVVGVITANPLGEAVWGVDADVLSQTRSRLRQRTWASVLVMVSVTLLLMLGPLVSWRRACGAVTPLLLASLAMAMALTLAWQLLLRAIAPLGLPAVEILASALLMAGLVSTAATGLTLLRRHYAATRVSWGAGSPVIFAVAQTAMGLLAATLVARYTDGLVQAAALWPVEWLHFGLLPWEPARLVSLCALIVLNATVIGAGVTLLRVTTLRWALTRVSGLKRALLLGLWGAGACVVLWLLVSPSMRGPAVVVLLTVWWLALRMGPLAQRLYRSSQAARLLTLAMGLVLPSLAFYPAMLAAANEARRAHIVAVHAPAVLQQRASIQALMADVQTALDGSADLAATLRSPAAQAEATSARSDLAYRLWADTRLAQGGVTSNLELYNASGALISTFGLGLPNLTYSPPAPDAGCGWQVFEEVSSFFSEERRLAHASRWVCGRDADGQPTRLGALVVHVMLDYGNLTIGSGARAATRPVSLSVYGWSGRALYASASRAWSLPTAVREQAQATRAPFWVTLPAGPATQEAYVVNDRAGIYVLAMPTLSALDHLLIISEVVALGLLVLLGGLAGMSVFGLAAGRAPTSARLIVREVRASFYRKLFLTFVAAAVIPVVALALVFRAYVGGVLRSDIELEAIHTVTSAARIVEDITAQADLEGADDDALVVWLSRVVAQDIDLFQGATLLATSERGRFASGERGLRTPSAVYQAIRIDQAPAFVWDATDAGRPVMSVAAPVRVKGTEAILMVPQTVRQREIAEQVAELDRRVLLAAILFIMLGASLGYRAAERVADPVGRLTRAARRIAQGELDVRVLVTTADELRQLVEAFNGMVADLERQRAELERTNRLAAWADMARQIAHDIKNPLTPIQLSAEHLLRVHNDRGRPLGEVVDECVAGILTQVRLLRQISSEFSSFASTPTVRLSSESLSGLVAAIVDPYRTGLPPTTVIVVDIPESLPRVSVDPLLFGRALTNIIENALQSMPSGGVLTFTGTLSPSGQDVALSVSDTGAGMSPEVVARLFEPYFSTKTRGTGLGLTIARRNIEACGGQVTVESAVGRGTTVRMTLPLAAPMAMAPTSA